MTTWVSVPVLLLKVVPSTKFAVMVWLPTDRLLMAPLVATPLVRFTALPKFVPSITNWTVPVGVPEVAATVAVKVTLWPNTDELAEELTVVVVPVAGALCTVCAKALLVLPAKLVSLPYVAVI